MPYNKQPARSFIIISMPGNMKKYFIIFILTGVCFALTAAPGRASGLTERLKGRILLAVESRGEAWYVSPEDMRRHFLGRPDDAFALMRRFGIGITGRDLKRIAVGLVPGGGEDTDADGAPDALERALGTDPYRADTDGDGFTDREEIESGHDPLGPGRLPIDSDFAAAQSGRIFLQVEGRGEAWYVNPADHKRYFLGRPDDAFALMRFFGLGIKKSDLDKIAAVMPTADMANLERLIHDLVNQERRNRGLGNVVWNNELAAVAREHSRNLARENEVLTGFNRSCAYAFIHHEGFDFGAYNPDRLRNRDVHYFSWAGENISIEPAGAIYVSYPVLEEAEELLADCLTDIRKTDAEFKARLEQETDELKKLNLVQSELAKRKNKFDISTPVKLDEIEWKSEEAIATAAVTRWLNSPGHRENMLKSDYDETGIGTAYINGHFITTQVFITRADCGFETGPCCEKPGYYPYCFTPLSCAQGICRGD